MQRIGVVVHGPEIIDSGCAISLINYLKKQKHSSVAAVLGGTMGRVAVIDAGLEDVICINPRQRPSQSILDLQDTSDVIFLLNQAKSRESGLVFGTMVAKAAGINKPLIQIDCGGRFVALLAGNEGERDLALQVASDLGLDCLHYPLLPIVTLGKKTTKRAISGVIPKELISINGIVIGRATEGQVELEAKDGKIVGLKGVDPKEHGLEKLSRFDVDLKTAIIRSGSIRRSEAGPRVRVDERANKRANKGEEEWAVLIDHCAEDAFEAALGASLAVTVGDDTTQIAADILARLGIPVIGIVDGDLDHLVGAATMLPGSVVLQVMPGHDDLVGKQVKAEIFRGEKRICIGADDIVNKIMKMVEERVLRVDKISDLPS
jgi:hypothetical protein